MAPRSVRKAACSQVFSDIPGLRPEVIGSPSLYHLLDGLATLNIVRQHFSRQRRKLRVTCEAHGHQLAAGELADAGFQIRGDRKSTRLNSSHQISYAVFCLKKKTKTTTYKNSRTSSTY